MVGPFAIHDTHEPACTEGRRADAITQQQRGIHRQARKTFRSIGRPTPPELGFGAGRVGRQGTVYAVAGRNRIRRAQWQTAYRRDWLLVNNRNRRRERPAASFFRPGSMDFSANAPPRASTFFSRKTKSPPFSTYPRGNVSVLSRETKNSPRGVREEFFLLDMVLYRQAALIRDALDGLLSAGPVRHCAMSIVSQFMSSLCVLVYIICVFPAWHGVRIPREYTFFTKKIPPLFDFPRANVCSRKKKSSPPRGVPGDDCVPQKRNQNENNTSPVGCGR